MRKILFFLIVCNFVGCVSVEKYNSKISEKIDPKKLKSDVAFTYRTLQKYHPNLYWYISKDKLDSKFDSLQKSIASPATSFEFYKKLAVVTNSIGQGHFNVYPVVKRYSKARIKSLTKKGNGPLSQFDFEVFDNKMFVVKNKSKNNAIANGSEIVAINNTKVENLLREYATLFTSDGYNKTLFRHGLSRKFTSYFSNQNGVLDSLKYDFKLKDSLKTVIIKRMELDSNVTKRAKISLTKIQRKTKKQKNSLLGYDAETKKYMRNLSFMQKDSSVAVIKINGFKIGDYRKCYQTFFEKIAQNKSKILVLDLRNNGGGRLNEISNLYKYLADTTFVFLKPSEVASKTSLMQMNYFKGSPMWLKPFQIVGAPVFYSYIYLKTYKKDGKFYTNTKIKPQKITVNNFKGKIYVLINGGSFSASSIISSNLKGSKRATFVGEETGGAYNGTVAGQMPNIKLPNSGLLLRVGLMTCTPFYQTEMQGRGIFPDVEIVPTISDRINNVDPEMQWVLKEVENLKLN